MRRVIGLFAVLIFALPLTLSAQVSSRGLLSQEALSRYGLEKMWQTQVDFDTARGRLVEVTMQVSNERGVTLFEIVDQGRRQVVSQHDRNAFNQEIGIDGAQAKANAIVAKIKEKLKEQGKPESDAPSVVRRLIPRVRLYATSERGTVHAIDGETGKTVWSTTVGRASLPMSSAAANDDYVGVCNGSTLYILDSETGSITNERRVMGAPSTGPAVSEDSVFVPMISGAVERYQIDEPKRPPYIFKSFGRPSAQPVVSLNSVTWPTESGKLYVGYSQEGGMRYRIEAKDAITSAPVMSNDKILFCSHDGYVYCVSEARGSILWRFTTGERISQSPLVVGDTVFAITDVGGIFSLSLETGLENWVSSGVRGFIAGNAERIYCYDRTGNTHILSAKSGNRLGQLMTAGLDVKVQNGVTDRIIMGNSSGVLQCIREVGQYWPDYRDPDANVPAAKKAAKKGAAAAPAAGAAEPADGVDPFGGDDAKKPAEAGAEDPFGDGAAKGEAMPEKEEGGAASAEDPFK
ncbi:MAG: PQQ-binding-like beta-propeller repeat protein [Planctomycetaceae bacterium]